MLGLRAKVRIYFAQRNPKFAQLPGLRGNYILYKRLLRCIAGLVSSR